MDTVLCVVDPAVTAAEVATVAADAVSANFGICVEPTLLPACKAVSEANLPVITWAGYPTGKHHSLVKAAEARLAVQFGATEVAIVPDLAAVADSSAFMSELISIREAVPRPAKLSVVLDTTVLEESVLLQAARCAAKSGFDGIVTGTRGSSVAGVNSLRQCAEVQAASMSVHVLTPAETAEEFVAQSYWIINS